MFFVFGSYSITIKKIKPSSIESDEVFDKKYNILYRQSIYHFCGIPFFQKENYWCVEDIKSGKKFELPNEMLLRADFLDYDRKYATLHKLIANLGWIFVFFTFLFGVYYIIKNENSKPVLSEQLIDLQIKLQQPKIGDYYRLTVDGSREGTYFKLIKVNPENLCFTTPEILTSPFGEKNNYPKYIERDSVQNFENSKTGKIICIERKTLEEIKCTTCNSYGFSDVNIKYEGQEISNFFGKNKFRLDQIIRK